MPVIRLIMPITSMLHLNDFRKSLILITSLRIALFYKHGIAIAEKPVFLAYRLIIRPEYMFSVVKGRYEHDERRLRQMKIRNQSVNYSEFVARINKYVCTAAFVRNQVFA